MGGWTIEPGAAIRRVELHDEFGGGRQGGIAPSRRSPNVLIFSDPGVGEQHGYLDRWVDDEYHYVGEGQIGPQSMDRGNAAILNHVADGRALRLFWGVRGTVEYAGEFELADPNPWFVARAKETGSDRQRDVITFRLVPRGEVEPVPAGRSTGRRNVRPQPPQLSRAYLPADQAHASAPRDPFQVDPDAVDRGLVGHARTQNALAGVAESHGFAPLSPASPDPDFDLAWRTIQGCVVVEVKSLTNANESRQLRLGLGQVLDYAHSLRRTWSHVLPVLAVEREPTEDRWIAICEGAGVRLVWPAIFESVM